MTDKPESKKRITIIVVVGLILSATCIAIIPSADDESGNSDGSGVAELDAAARRTSTQLIVINNSDEMWTDCEVAINPGVLRGGWTTEGVTIGAGDTVAGGLMSFTDSDGARFNPSTHAVESVGVICQTPRGRAIWSGAW